MRDLIDLVEVGFDWHREAEYGAKISSLLMDAQKLQRELADLAVAPTVQAQLDAAASTIVTYLDGMHRHTERNLNPSRR